MLDQRRGGSATGVVGPEELSVSTLTISVIGLRVVVDVVFRLCGIIVSSSATSSSSFGENSNLPASTSASPAEAPSSGFSTKTVAKGEERVREDVSSSPSPNNISVKVGEGGEGAGGRFPLLVDSPGSICLASSVVPPIPCVGVARTVGIVGGIPEVGPWCIMSNVDAAELGEARKVLVDLVEANVVLVGKVVVVDVEEVTLPIGVLMGSSRLSIPLFPWSTPMMDGGDDGVCELEEDATEVWMVRLGCPFPGPGPEDECVKVDVKGGGLVMGVFSTSPSASVSSRVKVGSSLGITAVRMELGSRDPPSPSVSSPALEGDCTPVSPPQGEETQLSACGDALLGT